MNAGNPIESVAAALHAACLRDLPAIEYLDRDWQKHRAFLDSLSTEARAAFYASEREAGNTMLRNTITKVHRPTPDQCEVIMFPQTWGSTALGYGGVGGQAITSAYTVIVRCQYTGTRAVYFGRTGALAYLVPNQGLDESEEAYRCAVSSQAMPSVAAAVAFGWERPKRQAAGLSDAEPTQEG